MGNFGYIVVDLILSFDIRLSSVSTRAPEHVYGALIVIPLLTDLPSLSENICAQLPRKQALSLLKSCNPHFFHRPGHTWQKKELSIFNVYKSKHFADLRPNLSILLYGFEMTLRRLTTFIGLSTIMKGPRVAPYIR
jgi:hypothetical protein